MPIEPIRCPACGAADLSRADSHGVHVCTYCGSRYRLTRGRGQVLPPAKAPRAFVPALIAVLLLGLSGAFVGYFAVGSAPEPMRPVPARPAAVAPLVAPASNPTLALTPAETATPAEEIPATATFEEHHRKEAGGALWIYGFVTNTSPFLTGKVEVIAVLNDADGKELGTKSGYSNRDVLAPDATSPVVILLKDTPYFASITWEIDVDAANYVATMASGLRLEAGAPSKGQFGGWEVEGKVFNEGDQPAQFVNIEVQGWSEDGRLIGISQTFAKSKLLKPGESSRFKLASLRFDQEPARFEMHVEGRVPRP